MLYIIYIFSVNQSCRRQASVWQAFRQISTCREDLKLLLELVFTYLSYHSGRFSQLTCTLKTPSIREGPNILCEMNKSTQRFKKNLLPRGKDSSSPATKKIKAIISPMTFTGSLGECLAAIRTKGPSGSCAGQYSRKIGNSSLTLVCILWTRWIEEAWQEENLE